MALPKISAILLQAADLCALGWTRTGITDTRDSRICYSADGALWAAAKKIGEDYGRAALYLRAEIGTHNITIWNGRWWRRKRTVVHALRKAAVAAWRAGE